MLLISSMLTSIVAKSQTFDKNILSKLNEYAIPYLQSDSSDVVFYRNISKDRKVIAIGEATHGTHEFYAAKDKIIRNLVQYHNVKTIAFETDFCGLEALNDFVLNKYPDSANGEAKFIGLYGLYGIYRTAEVYDMVKWLQAFNSTKSPEEKVTFNGIDMQDPYYISSSLLNDSKHISLSSANIEILTKIKNSYWAAKELKIKKSDEIIYQQLIEDLNVVAKNLKDNVANNVFKRHIRLLEQTFSLRGVNFSTYRERRDQYLAENALWLLNNNKVKNAKMVIWAHNGHITYSNNQNPKRFGYYLKEKLGQSYFALALTFDEGSVRIFDVKGKERGYKEYQYESTLKKNAIEYLFKNCRDSSFFVDFKDLNSDELMKKKIKEHKYMRVIGAEFLPDDKSIFFQVPILDSFDGILFFKKTSAAKQLKNKT